MNPGPILALISDLYAQVNELAQENQQLREALELKPGDEGQKN